MDLSRTSNARRRRTAAVPGLMTSEGMRGVVARRLGTTPEREFTEALERINLNGRALRSR